MSIDLQRIARPSSRRRHTRGGKANAGVVCVGLALLVSFAGCSRFDSEYGESSGRSGRNSINGFGALRKAYESAGHDTHDLKRLSRRAERNDVIVWLPKVMGPISDDATEWLETWLEGGNRSLVYVLPDSGSETAYWRQAARLAPPSQRLEYRRRAGRSVNRRVAERLIRSEVPSNGWFEIKPLHTRSPLGDPQGPWSDALSETLIEPQNKPVPTPSAAFGNHSLATELLVTEYDEKATQSGASASKQNSPPQPAAPWIPNQSTSITETETQLRALLGPAGEGSVIAEVTSEDWNGSRILVVAGGSLLTNFAFTDRTRRQLAQRIISESTPSGDSDLHTGFLETGRGGVAVSKSDAAIPRSEGMELLTVWPLSLVTMHAVALGLVACLMLLPVFGRPQHLRHRRQTSFGDHLDAVAALMSRTGGETYARQRISEYMRRIRGETAGAWVLPEDTPSATTGSSTSNRPDEDQAHVDGAPETKNDPSEASV